MSEQPSTPPRTRHSGALPPNPLTPEQVRRTEEARLRAKALRAQADATRQGQTSTTAPSNLHISHTAASSSSGQKRPHAQISRSNVSDNVRDASAAASAAAMHQAPKLSTPTSDLSLKAAKKFERNAFIDYDFAKMTDTRGGFMTSLDDPHNKALYSRAALEAESQLSAKPAHMTLAEWERNQLLKKLRANKAGPFEPGISNLDGYHQMTSHGGGNGNGSNVKNTCRECSRFEIDHIFLSTFACAICQTCKDLHPDKYSLLTKTEARDDYLLTNPELEDKDLFKTWERPNPHKATWNNMHLYLRYQVEEYAFSEAKWGSAEKLDEEFERRVGGRKVRREKVFKKKLGELKKRTRVEAYRRSRAAAGSNGDDVGGGGGGGGARFGDRVGREERHEHEWGRPVDDPETGVCSKSCIICGMVCEEIEF